MARMLRDTGIDAIVAERLAERRGAMADLLDVAAVEITSAFEANRARHRSSPLADLVRDRWWTSAAVRSGDFRAAVEAGFQLSAWGPFCRAQMPPEALKQQREHILAAVAGQPLGAKAHRCACLYSPC